MTPIRWTAAESHILFETLRKFAEVGVAIAGFSAIAAALNRQQSYTRGSPERGGLVTLLETAGLVVLFSLLPQVLVQAPLDESQLWRVASLSYALINALHAVIIVRRYRTGQTISSATGPLIVGGFAVVALQVAVGIFGNVASMRPVYLGVLSWHVLIAAISFASLITIADRDEAV